MIVAMPLLGTAKCAAAPGLLDVLVGAADDVVDPPVTLLQDTDDGML